MASFPLRIGTAGWSVSSRYASDIPLGGSHLERYARSLNAVEINSSFYRPHQFKTYERWAHSTPKHFRFAVKVPKAITHGQRLADCKDILDRFVEEVSGLGAKLGVLLVQLPPTLALEKRVAGRFFRDLRKRVDVPIACEPRHESWFAPKIGDGSPNVALRVSPPIPRQSREQANPAAGAGLPIIAGTARRAFTIQTMMMLH